MEAIHFRELHPIPIGRDLPRRSNPRSSSVEKATLAAAALTFAAVSSAQGQIDFADVLGRHVSLEKPAEKVRLGFFFED